MKATEQLFMLLFVILYKVVPALNKNMKAVARAVSISIRHLLAILLKLPYHMYMILCFVLFTKTFLPKNSKCYSILEPLCNYRMHVLDQFAFACISKSNL